MGIPYGIQPSFARVAHEPAPIQVAPNVRTVAFYLPQFHPIAHNDRFWGAGFTEWVNVVRGTQETVDHYQPRIPADLGFYDLRLASVQECQSQAAIAAGLSAFCYYYYWFDGDVPMALPLENHISNEKIKIDFCLCFANENWTRTWDGRDRDVLLEQSYGPGFARRFWNDAARYIKSEKYLRDAEGKPYLLIYRPNIIPDFLNVAREWRGLAKEDGFAGLNILGNLAFSGVNMGLDGTFEFPPLAMATVAEKQMGQSVPKKYVYGKSPSSASIVFDYRQFLMRERKLASAPDDVLPTVAPSWDNTCRRPDRGLFFANSCPESFRRWVEEAARRASRTKDKLLFVNAWNEWAEGAYLEPDQKFGWAYLAALRDGLTAAAREQPTSPHPFCIFVHIHYLDVWDEMKTVLQERVQVPFRLVITTSLDVDIELPETRYLEDVEIHRVPNMGRDIFPFLIAIDKTRFEFDIGLKLHTKRSPHRADGNEWRRFLIESLVPASGVANVAELFQVDPNIGFVSPDAHWSPLKDFKGSNGGIMANVLAACGMEAGTHYIETGRFIAGSMFWFRRDAVSVMTCGKVQALFCQELDRLDGTAAHAAERLFALCGERLGYVTVTMGDVKPLLQEVRRGRYSIRDRLGRYSDQMVAVPFREKIALSNWRQPGWVAWLASSNNPASLAYRCLPASLRRRIRSLVGLPV